jgi:sRNA-binding regulator protein Hfq
VQKDKPATPRKPGPARPTQIEHLLNLVGRHFDKDRDAVELEIGKPLEQLTRKEASDLLKKYQLLLTEISASDPSKSASQRKRAYLPEGVDQFEQEYLTTQQDAGAILHFTLFDGTKTAGRVIGFSPYSITIDEQGTGNELTLQKLAIAYYSVRPGQQPSAEVE